MKKILMRAGMSPLLNYGPAEVICGNLIGSNMGNMLFQYSVSRVLLKKNIQIDTIQTRRSYTPEDIKRINETYECLVLPFANAFRQSFIEELDNATGLINKLDIPCIVVGIGAQASLDKEANSPELDASVKSFMKAVLNKSAMVGLRGEFTADYLAGLGFRPEKDFTIIGCPSMFMYGEELPEMEVKELTPESAVSMNSKISLPQKFHDFMWRSGEAFSDHVYIPQVIEEIRRMFAGIPYPKSFWDKEAPKHFPADFNAPVYSSGNGLAFTNVSAWLKFLKKRDFSFGSRIHGNIAAIQAGTPSFVIVSDRRVQELVDYHNIPHMQIKDLTAETDIFKLYDKADFSALRKGHKERFAHYIDFLHANKLKTIFDGEKAQKKVPFDTYIKEIKFTPWVKAFSVLTPERQLQRLEAVYRHESRKNRFYKDFYFQTTASTREKWSRRRRGELPEPVNTYFPLIREYEAEAARLNKKNSTSESNEPGA